MSEKGIALVRELGKESGASSHINPIFQKEGSFLIAYLRQERRFF